MKNAIDRRARGAALFFNWLMKKWYLPITVRVVTSDGQRYPR